MDGSLRGKMPVSKALVLLFAAIFSATTAALPGVAEGDLDVSDAANQLGERLKALAAEQLGSAEALRRSLSEPEEETPAAVEARVASLAAAVEEKTRAATELLSRVAEAASKALQGKQSEFPAPSEPVVTESCCDVPNGLLRFDSRFGTAVNDAVACHVGPFEDKSLASNLTVAIKSSSDPPVLPRPAGFLWQYLMTADGHHLEYPASRFSCGLRGDSRHRDAYLTALHGGRKHVVVALDRGAALSGADRGLMDVARAAVRYVLAGLTAADTIGFVTFAESVYFPLDADCLAPKMVPATSFAQLELLKFINVVHASGAPADHAGALRAIEDMIKNSDVGRNAVVQVLYLSAGIIDEQDKHEAMRALSELKERHSKTIINTYHLANEEQAYVNTREAQFLQSLSAFSMEEEDSTAGQSVVLTSSRDVGTAIGDFMGGQVRHERTSSVSIIPRWDDSTHLVVITLSLPLRSQSGGRLFIGSTGVDLKADVYFEDLMFYNEGASDGAYAALLERVGDELRVMYHPSVYSTTNPRVPETTFAQVADGPSAEISTHMMAKPAGSRREKSLLYTWKWVDGTDFIVFIVKKIGETTSRKSSSYSLASQDAVRDHDAPPPIFHHRLDLLSSEDHDSRLCRLKSDSVSTLSGAALFLAANAFSSPRQDLQGKLAANWRRYLAYLNDRTGLVSNPGLAANVKGDVTTASGLVPSWKNSTCPSGESDSCSMGRTVDRFVATSGGVYMAYPGEALPAHFDFTSMKWYGTALGNPDKLAVSGPSLHPSGSGYAVTISQSIAGRGGNPKAVWGLNIPLGLLVKEVVALFPDCQTEDARCFVIDEEGSLVYHDYMLDVGYTGTLEKQHLNDKEPNVGKDLLSSFDRGLVVDKHFCRSHLESTVRRYYSYNVDMGGDETFSGVLHGSNGGNCSRYAVTAVAGTNLLFGMVRSSCPVAAVFCPCSINSRKCIVCKQRKDEAKRYF